MTAFISEFLQNNPAEIQVDSTGLVEYSYKPTEAIIESLRYAFTSIPIEDRVRANFQDLQWCRRAEDVDEAARSLALPSFDHLDLVSEHKADGVNYQHDTLVLTYALPVNDFGLHQTQDFYATKFWWDGKTLNWVNKVYMTYTGNSLSELSNLGIDYEYAFEYGCGANQPICWESPDVWVIDEYFYLRGKDCETIWERLGFERQRLDIEDNSNRGLFAITVRETAENERELIKLKRYYYPNDPRLEKDWR